MLKNFIKVVVLGSAVLTAGEALAGPSPSQRCESARNREAGKYIKCLHKAEADLVAKKGACSSDGAKCFADADCASPQTCDKDLTRYDKGRALCERFFAGAWERHAATASRKGDPCPALPTYEEARADAEAQASAVAVAMTGTGFVPAPGCGDGTVDAGEDCDVGDLNGGTCVGEGFAGGTLGCGAGCVYDTGGCYAERYVDNGDGTVSDNETGLMWEQKTDDWSIHDAREHYTWGSRTAPYAPDGTAFTDHIARLNGSADGICFAGHCDWRLPTIEELQTILLRPHPCGTNPCIDQSIFGPILTGPTYWSASTWSTLLSRAFCINFEIGFVDRCDKGVNNRVRAVRSGS